MIRVASILAKLAESWPKIDAHREAVSDQSLASQMAPETAALTRAAPQTPAEVETAVSRAGKAYRRGHRRKVCLVSPDGVFHERWLETGAQ